MTLLDTYYPFDTGAGANATSARWRAMARYFYGSGVIPTIGNAMRPSQAGSVVTIQTGAAWMDGFYGENTANKTVTVSGNGQVVARMDPNARTISYVFVPNQTVPTQSLTGIFELPIWQVTGAGAGHDARQYSTSLPSKTVIATNFFRTAVGTSWGSTAWAGWWSLTIPKIRPDSVFDFYYMGSAYGTVAGGWMEYGIQITGPNASGTGILVHFFFNTASEHHTAAAGYPGLGAELVAANYVGNVTATVYVRNMSTTAPAWHTDGNDYHTIQVIERMP